MLLASGFYFWEQYLLDHFLGGFHEQGMPVIHSGKGFYFFFKVWPVWAFPLIVNNLLILFLAKKYYQFVVHRFWQLRQERFKLKNEIKELQRKLINLNHSQSATRSVANKDYNALEKAYNNLASDYQQSTDFIEKLLDKINKQNLG